MALNNLFHPNNYVLYINDAIVTKLELADGSASAPSIAFADSLNTGIYHDVGNSAFGISVGGVETQYNTNAETVVLRLVTGNGSVGTPAIQYVGATGAGIFWDAGNDSNGIANGVTFSNVTASYVPSVLSYYEETVPLVDWKVDANTTSSSVTIIRIGKMVSLTVNSFSITATSGVDALTIGTTPLPLRFRPTSSVEQAISLNQSGNTYQVVMDNSGVLTITDIGVGTLAAAAYTVPRFSVTYNLL